MCTRVVINNSLVKPGLPILVDEVKVCEFETGEKLFHLNLSKFTKFTSLSKCENRLHYIV